MIQRFLKEKEYYSEIINNNKLSLYFKNISYLIICLWSSYALATNNIHPYLFDSISIYTLIDTVLYKNKMDVVIHHIFLLTLSYFHYSYNGIINQVFYHEMKKLCLNMELSSVFLGLMPFVKKNKTLEQINIVLFTIVFFYSRIYNYSIKFIFHKEKHEYMIEFYDSISKSGYYIFYFIFMGFYLLNIYWFVFIIKKMMKKIKKD